MMLRSRPGYRRVGISLAAVTAAALLLASPGIVSAATDPDDPVAGDEVSLQAAVPSTGWEDNQEATDRAAALLAQMTLEEKVDMLHGELNNYYGFYNAPIERLGIPALTMADGPAGTRIANPEVNGKRSTELPSPLLMAATWDEELSEQYGQLAAEEAFSSGHNVLLSPAVDIARVALAGRAFEAFGEDPLLSGTMGANNLQGIQSQPVIGDVKHYNVYTQEQNRLVGGNAVVDERTLQEIYSRPFDIGVESGHPGSAMCAFNKVNGLYACESPDILTTILKEQFDFQGWVMSDYGATHSTTAAIMAGLDQEMPGNFSPDEQPGTSFFGQPLIDAVNAGEVPIARVDDAVTRILRPMFALGLFDQRPVVQPLPEAEHGAQAREFAERGMVLLKNDDLLPLAGDAASIAVIGADADVAVQGGGSSQVLPTYTVSPLQGISERAGDDVAVTHIAGADPVTGTALLPGPQPIPSDYLTPSIGEGQGLYAEYFANQDFSGEPTEDRVEPYVGVNGGFLLYEGFNSSSPHFPLQTGALNTTDLSIRWSGSLTAPVDGTYQLALVSKGTTTVYLDDEAVFTTTPSGTAEIRTVDIPLVAGESHTLRVEYVNDVPAETDTGPAVKLAWTAPEGVVAPQAQAAADLAAESDIAVVVARDYSSEGSDRPSLDLPNGQDRLIQQVAAANPRTIVVLTSGAAVQTSEWDGSVPAVLQSWYGGQEQGNAIARILFGDVNPSGRLPITIPVDEASTPVSSPAQYPGTGLDQSFSEGIFVGYRGYEQFGIEPQYSFGHGLSYTTYDYSRLRVRSDGVEAAAGEGYSVDVRVENTGDVAGTETVQVYAGPLPTDAVETAPKSLAGWAQVDLQPGERKRVQVSLDPDSFSYWDVDADTWVTPAGAVPLYVGTSSSDIRLTGELQAAPTPVAPVATTLPAITGDPTVGKRLRADTGVWDQESLDFSYQWLRDGEPIPGADDDRYRVQEADRGAQLSVQVTATPEIGPAGVAASEPVTVRTDAEVTVTPDPARGDTDTEFTVTVTVAPRQEGVVAEGTVTLRVDSQRFIGTLANGTVDIPIGEQDRGTHRIRVTYSGSDLVEPAKGSASIRVTR
ncbi:beta-glucosidase [Conyzicola lurida]|uniref:Beta-glucosidase n=1 Tax=Conyzicola lurida TaxID=1172621 RepID=A0A841ALA7_9MICO|nr:glycoside hydrolase family 3 C-terminal domain-containing protein [Conyzicola lurida]MBB5842486.1 beta-glucosidase [Conyzicola lurida]